MQQVAFPRICEPDCPFLSQGYLDAALVDSKFNYRNLVQTSDRQLNFYGAQVLDIACGIGNSSYRLARQLPTSKVIGLDNDPLVIAVADRTNKQPDTPNLEFRVRNCNDFTETGILTPISFMAAFTPREIKGAFKETGLSVVKMDSDGHRFEGIAVKNK